MSKKTKYGTDFSAKGNHPGLSARANEYLRALNDLDTIRNDPGYSQANDQAVSMIVDFMEGSSRSIENKKFIENSFSEHRQNRQASREMDSLRKEISETGADMTASEWVREWNEKKASFTAESNADRERREFIASALESKDTEEGKKSGRMPKPQFIKSPFIRYAALAAALFAGAFLIVRTLLQPVDPQSLYNKYYSPFAAVSAVTRSSAAIADDDFNRAIGYYRSGHYTEAADLFSEATLNGSGSGPSTFFLGLSEIGLGNPDRAVALLEKIADTPGEYSGDARWYLGLAYLMRGEKQKAMDSFRLLAQSGGFYSARSEKILRRLR
jgi:tetratricopeptide (TPR) repeat protein